MYCNLRHTCEDEREFLAADRPIVLEQNDNDGDGAEEIAPSDVILGADDMGFDRNDDETVNRSHSLARILERWDENLLGANCSFSNHSRIYQLCFQSQERRKDCANFTPCNHHNNDDRLESSRWLVATL